MEREGADLSLHERLMLALARGADTTEVSRATIEETRAIDEELRATLAAIHGVREERAREPDVRIRTRR